MHASHIKKKKRLQPNFQSLLLNFKICNCVTKIRFVFNENTDKFLELKKSDFYLMKIQISFVLKKLDLYLMKIHISFYV